MTDPMKQKQGQESGAPSTVRVRLSDAGGSTWSQLLLQFKQEERDRAQRASFRRKFEKTFRGRILSKIAD